LRPPIRAEREGVLEEGEKGRERREERERGRGREREE